MNVHNLGIPIYGEKPYEYVLREDLQLALDRDIFQRVEAKWLKETAADNGQVMLEWLEQQH